MGERERRVVAGLRGPSGEVLRLIALQPVRGGEWRGFAFEPIPVPRPSA